VNTPAQVNNLEFAIKNNDSKKKTFANYIYVQVESTQRLGKSQPDADGTGILPRGYSLSHNYPNPFNPTTMIQYDLPFATFVTMRIFDVLGQEVAVLLQEYKKAGRYTVAFDAEDLPSGIYLYQMQTDDFAETKKLLLLR
jgi:hypothetical protein